jgi:6,7-dimethyl-8-ribityllumazine synthase
MILILTSRFYPEISDKLEESTEKELTKNGIKYEKTEVRGCIELPSVAQHFIRTRKVNAVIALGVIIQGETDHYKWVCESCERGLTRVALDEGVPVIHGILACPNRKLAEARTKNGAEYAITALKMIQTLQS